MKSSAWKKKLRLGRWPKIVWKSPAHLWQACCLGDLAPAPPSMRTARVRAASSSIRVVLPVPLSPHRMVTGLVSVHSSREEITSVCPG